MIMTWKMWLMQRRIGLESTKRAVLGLISVIFFFCGSQYSDAKTSPKIKGFATFYTLKSCQREGTSGVYTANGERYDEESFTCALPNHAFNGLFKVCRIDAESTPCVLVRHNDFGPGRGPQRKGVIIDLTPAAFKRLGNLKQGRMAVTVERLGDEEGKARISSLPVVRSGENKRQRPHNAHSNHLRDVRMAEHKSSGQRHKAQRGIS